MWLGAAVSPLACRPCRLRRHISPSHLPAVGDEDGKLGLRIGADGGVLDLADREHPVYHLAEDDVLVVEPIASVARDKELAAVCARTRVCHRQQPAARVLQLEVLVLKLVTVDARAASAVALEEVAALHHEPLDYTVEPAAFEPHRLAEFAKLARAKLPEVLGRLGNAVRVELHLYSACIVAADRDVHEHDRIAVGQTRHRTDAGSSRPSWE
eukprot:CAMPEP_0206159958 /NCGR_PEP_ID=MMETSP1474-20131121/6331_1 /ASSEMBLY_ACC=CAM_ASM_001110 /TAXON_ID=97495 /ORGANISM="Imantonia sp., Strain RCC918" /LENGTH=211 /DNA_ID=CAMNT_0053561007 /DNA_START=144 /DNA_END=776 /DNA_ORIENTATION=-